jgi:hypothetical protein
MGHPGPAWKYPGGAFSFDLTQVFRQRSFVVAKTAARIESRGINQPRSGNTSNIDLTVLLWSLGSDFPR